MGELKRLKDRTGGAEAEIERLRGENARLAKELDAARQTERILAFRLHLMIFGRCHDLSSLLTETLDKIEELTGSRIGFYHFIQEDQKTLTLQAWSTNTAALFCSATGKGSHYDIDKAGVWVDCVREKRPVIHNDYAALPHKKGMPPGHARVLRELTVPVLRGDRVVAVIGVGNKETDYTEGDVEVVTRFADLAWDIAERKIHHESQMESEARFRAIADYSYDWELWISTDGRVVWTNPAAVEMTGYAPEELIAMEEFPAPLLRDAEKEKIARHFEQARQGESANNVEFRLKRKDGKFRWVGISYRPIFGQAGEPMGFRASVRDIDEQKQAELEVDRLNEKLIEMLASRAAPKRD